MASFVLRWCGKGKRVDSKYNRDVTISKGQNRPLHVISFVSKTTLWSRRPAWSHRERERASRHGSGGCGSYHHDGHRKIKARIFMARRAKVFRFVFGAVTILDPSGRPSMSTRRLFRRDSCHGAPLWLNWGVLPMLRVERDNAERRGQWVPTQSVGTRKQGKVQ